MQGKKDPNFKAVMQIVESVKGTQQDFEDIMQEIGAVAKVKFYKLFCFKMTKWHLNTSKFMPKADVKQRSEIAFENYQFFAYKHEH